jgi:hypothetical protein
MFQVIWIRLMSWNLCIGDDMNKKQYENEFRKYWFRLVVKPAIFLFGIYIASELINMFMKNDLFKDIILYGGIIGFLIVYFKKELSE